MSVQLKKRFSRVGNIQDGVLKSVFIKICLLWVEKDREEGEDIGARQGRENCLWRCGCNRGRH